MNNNKTRHVTIVGGKRLPFSNRGSGRGMFSICTVGSMGFTSILKR